MLTVAALAGAAVAHVPIYPDGDHYTVDRDANTSQVIYFPDGNGEVTVPHAFLTHGTPWEYYVDVVIRDEEDFGQMTVEIICGTGETPGAAPCDADGTCATSLGEGHLEPFTQTSYFPILGEDFQVECQDEGSKDLNIKVGRDDTPGGTHPRGPMAIVVGKGEEFTFEELMSVGHYALLNHGSWWNEAGWTYWVFLTLVAVIVVVACKMTESYGVKREVVFDDKARELLYWCAIVGFGAGFLETTTHTGIAQAPVPVGGELGMAIVIILLNLVFMAVILLNMYLDMEWIQSAVWAPFELGTAFSCFLLFGVGYYVAPTFWMCAALVRMYRLVTSNSLYS